MDKQSFIGDMAAGVFGLVIIKLILVALKYWFN